MRRLIIPSLIILIVAYFAYTNRDILINNSKFIIHNPAESVLNSNVPERDTISVFQSEIYGKIYLFAGNEAGYGLRHILARHTTKYFINFDNKNKNTLFDDEVSGKDILIGIEEFYKHCVDIGIYNRKADRNVAFVGFTKLKGKDVKCLLITRKDSNEIITFYPFNEIKESEILREIEERERFHYD